MLHKDIVRKLVSENPELASRLLPTCRTVHHWITSDDVLMKKLKDHYRDQIQTELDTQVSRLFNQQAACSVTPRHVLNVHVTEVYGKKNAQISYDTGGTRNTSFGQLKVERDNPQSRDAYRKLMRLWWRSKTLANRFGSTEREQTVDDVCQGVKHALQQCNEHKTPMKFQHWAALWCASVLMGVVFIVLMRTTKGSKGGFALTIGLTMLACYALLRSDVFRWLTTL